MTLWLITTGILIIVCGLIARSVTRQPAIAEGSSDRVYADQLKEIDREEAAGLIDEADARMARLELQRRLLAAAPSDTAPEVNDMTNSDKLTLVASIVAIAIGSAAIYAVTGSPDVAAHPMGSRASQIVNADLRNLETQARVPSQTASQGQSLASVDDMIQRLETRLASEPDDVEGWRMLGWSKFRTGDTAGAAKAYARAVELDPDDSRILSVYGESLILSSGGYVSDTAADALRKAVALDPDDARARFLLGLKKQQDGDIEGTLDDWLQLLEDAPPGAEWFNDVYARAEELSLSSGIDITSRLPERRGALTPTPASSPAAATMPAPRTSLSPKRSSRNSASMVTPKIGDRK